MTTITTTTTHTDAIVAIRAALIQARGEAAQTACREADAGRMGGEVDEDAMRAVRHCDAMLDAIIQECDPVLADRAFTLAAS